MLKFFRAVRRKLLQEASLKKYFVYALGEILLVMIGILLALQVNNWNEQRKEKLKKKYVSSALFNELLKNQEYCELELSNINSNIKFLASILSEWSNLNTDKVQSLEKNEWAMEHFSLLYYITSYHQVFDPNYELYSSATNDGSITLLKNEEFVRDLNFIYSRGSLRMNQFTVENLELKWDINNYISEKYGDAFLEKNEADQTGISDTAFYNKFFSLIKSDGTLKYKVSRRLDNMKTRRLILGNQIIPRINQAIDSYNDR